jgi:peptidoglycan hydrolase FlgJ
VIAPVATSAQAAPDVRQVQLHQAADAFEAIFLRQMIGSMRNAGLTEDSFAGSSSGQFRDMFDGHIADHMAASGRFGIAEALVAQLGTTAR